MRFLLVHGTTQSPDGWRLLAGELAALGHEVVTTDLLEFGEDLSVAGYAAAVSAQQSGAHIDVVVAHSGAGLLLPAIATATQAVTQVFLAAGIPSGTRSLIEELSDNATSLVNEDWIGVDPTTDIVAARRFLFHDCIPQVADWACSTLRSFVPVSAYSARILLAPEIRAVSVVPGDDRTLRPDWMITASRQRLGVEPIIIEGGHCPHVSRPTELAAILDSAVFSR